MAAGVCIVRRSRGREGGWPGGTEAVAALTGPKSNLSANLYSTNLA